MMVNGDFFGGFMTFLKAMLEAVIRILKIPFIWVIGWPYYVKWGCMLVMLICTIWLCVRIWETRMDIYKVIP